MLWARATVPWFTFGTGAIGFNLGGGSVKGGAGGTKGSALATGASGASPMAAAIRAAAVTVFLISNLPWRRAAGGEASLCRISGRPDWERPLAGFLEPPDSTGGWMCGTYVRRR